MREHGLLKRILLIYDEVDARIAQQKEFPPDAVTNSAKIIRSFIEQYHEKLEEDYLFPRFRKHNLLVDLVTSTYAANRTCTTPCPPCRTSKRAELCCRRDISRARRWAHRGESSLPSQERL